MAKKQAKPSEDDLKLKAVWSQRIERGKKHLEENSKDWAFNEKLVFGINPEGDQGEDPVLAYGWGLVKALETAIYVQDPDFYVESKFGTNPDVARKLTDILRSDVKDMDLKSVGNMMLLDVFITGLGIGTEIIKTESKGVRYPAMDDLGIPEEEGALPVEQHFEIVRSHPKDVLFDPRGIKLDLSDHNWIALAFYPTIRELQDDPAFKLPEDVENLPEANQATRIEKGSVGSSFRAGLKTEEKDPAFKTVCVWEIWDKPNQKVIYMTDAGHHVLGSRDWPVRLRMGGRSLFPTTIMAMHPNPKGFYPKSEVSLVKRQLVQLLKLEASMERDFRIRWKKHAALATLISQDQAAHMVDPDPEHAVLLIQPDELGAVFGPTGVPPQLDLSRLVVQLEDPMVQKDFPMRKAMIEQDISQVLGYGPSDRGGLPQTRSAREAVMINDAKQQKLIKRADSIADFYRGAGEKHIQFLQQTLTVERAARKYDPAKGLGEWFTYDREAVQGNFNFVVYAGSSGPRSTEAKRAQEMQLFQTLAPILQMEGKSIYPALERLANVFQWDGIEVLFGNSKMELKNLAIALGLFSTGQVPPEQLIEQATRAVQTGLSNNDLAEVKRFLSGGVSGTGGQPGNPKGMRGDPGSPGAATGMM